TYFRDPAPGQLIRAVPGAGLKVPIWLLGSSLFSAQLAAALGLPFAFASHFAPDLLMEALAIYRSEFTPSESLAAPYAMAGVSVVAADTDAVARRLFTSLQIQFVNLRRGRPGPLNPPVDSLDDFWSPSERAGVEHALRDACRTYPVVDSAGSVPRLKTAFTCTLPSGCRDAFVRRNVIAGTMRFLPATVPPSAQPVATGVSTMSFDRSTDGPHAAAKTIETSSITYIIAGGLRERRGRCRERRPPTRRRT